MSYLLSILVCVFFASRSFKDETRKDGGHKDMAKNDNKPKYRKPNFKDAQLHAEYPWNYNSCMEWLEKHKNDLIRID